MNDRVTVHILDMNETRSVHLARLTFASGYYAVTYGSVDELFMHKELRGLILAHDDPAGGAISHLLDTMVEEGKWLPVIAIAEQPDTAKVVSAMRAGVMDYLPTPQETGILSAAIARAAAEATTRRAIEARANDARQLIARLTARELEVLQMIAQGASNKEIARLLCISPRTIEVHRKNMMYKLGASNASEAVRIMMEANDQPRLVAKYARAS